jgi:hypothetical protein
MSTTVSMSTSEATRSRCSTETRWCSPRLRSRTALPAPSACSAGSTSTTPRGAIVWIENAAGCEVLNVPAGRTHRDRHEQGRDKSDPGDAVAIKQVVLRKREQLGPALEPELIRGL